MSNIAEKLSAKRRWVAAFMTIYVFLVVGAFVIGIAYQDSSIGVSSLMVLGIPWSIIVTPCLWTVSHNSTIEGLLVMYVFFTTPNIFLLVRWIMKLYVEEKSYVD